MGEENKTTKTGPYRVRFQNKCEKLSKNEQKMLKIVKIGHLQ